MVASDLSEDPRRLRLASGGDPGSGFEFISLDVTRLNDLVAAVEDMGLPTSSTLRDCSLLFARPTHPLEHLSMSSGTVNVFEAVKRAGRASAWPTRVRPPSTAQAIQTPPDW